MKRLVMAAGIALSLHAVLLYGGWDPLGRGKRDNLRPHHVTLTLSYLPPPPKTPSTPVEKKAPVLEKVPQKPKPIERPPKKVKRQESTPKAVKKSRRKKEAPKKPEPVMKKEPSPPPPVEPESLMSTESALPPSFKENQATLYQLKQEESLPAETSATITSRERVAKLTYALPLYKENPAPKYPRVAKRKGYEGTVILDVFVNQEGKVESLEVFQSSGHTVLDKAAKKTVASWLFSPAKRGEEKIAMWIKVPIRFDLR